MCFVAVDSWFELLMSGREAVSRTIKSVSRSDSLCLHLHFQSRKASKGKASLCCSPATEEAFSISAQCKHWNEIAARPFCFSPHCADC